MAKKQKTQKVEVPVVETLVVETPKPKKVESKKDTWEVKDRQYYLRGDLSPLSIYTRSFISHLFFIGCGFSFTTGASTTVCST